LAEKLGVSRQAVSQWEQGQSRPEVENLVALADVFQVSLDRLVRDPEDYGATGSPRASSPGNPIGFLLRAKRATYAGHGAEVAPSRTSSHDLCYREGDLTYYDTYLGSGKFAGQEALWEGETPFWAMNYAGRVLAEGFSGDFLKQALALVPADRPFRGPPLHREGELTYTCTVEGSFPWFLGVEQIYRGPDLVFECRFHGGCLEA
jgi:transcriptional regulator with XRE-family HTH domain